MPYWENLGEDYLRSRGKTPAPDIRAQFKRRTLEGSAAYMKEAYGLEEPVEEVISGIVGGIERPYRELIPLKPELAVAVGTDGEVGAVEVLTKPRDVLDLALQV